MGKFHTVYSLKRQRAPILSFDYSNASVNHLEHLYLLVHSFTIMPHLSPAPHWSPTHNSIYLLIVMQTSILCRCSQGVDTKTSNITHLGLKLFLYKSAVLLQYATPLGTGWSNSTWINNTEEGTIGTSLYTRCPTFTLNLRGAAARVRLNLNLMVNRSK